MSSQNVIPSSESIRLRKLNQIYNSSIVLFIRQVLKYELARIFKFVKCGLRVHKILLGPETLFFWVKVSEKTSCPNNASICLQKIYFSRNVFFLYITTLFTHWSHHPCICTYKQPCVQSLACDMLNGYFFSFSVWNQQINNIIQALAMHSFRRQ